jgi:antitoxin Phd
MKTPPMWPMLTWESCLFGVSPFGEFKTADDVPLLIVERSPFRKYRLTLSYFLRILIEGDSCARTTPPVFITICAAGVCGGMEVFMMINTNLLVPMTEANQNFSKVVRIVDESGYAVILKNNKPRYMIVDFSEYDEIVAARKAAIGSAVDEVISDSIESLRELAK